MRSIQFKKSVILFLMLNIQVNVLAQEEYCCQRILMFPTFPMPEGQERDLSLAISLLWNSMINKTGAHELGRCPLTVELRSWEGNQEVDSLTENMKAATTKTKPDYPSDEEARKGADYIWKGKLELLSIDKIIPGEWEDAYVDENTRPGARHHEPGYAIGKWRFTIQLYNPFWGEVVKEASTSVWEGDGDLDEPYITLFSQNFSNLKEIILDYEKTPKKAEFESKVVQVDPEKTKRITFNVTDEKGEKPQKWQRLAVKVDFGSIINGTPCCELGEDAKFYSFMCEEGQVTIEYKAPDPDKTTFDHLTVYNGCIIKDPVTISMTNVEIQDVIGSVDIALIKEGYSGTITVTKTWDYTKDGRNYSIKNVGKQTVSFNGIFKPIPQMVGMEGQPITIYGPHEVSGTWCHNEECYCSGDCSCSGLNYQKFGSGDFPQESLQGLILITNLFPTDNKVVADQLGQFGLVSWYDIGTPTENVPIQTRTKSYSKDTGCTWDNSTGSINLTGSDARFKIKDINHLHGDISWSSSKESTSVSITDMTEAIYDPKQFDPEQDGTEYTYTVTWNLRIR